MATRRVKVETTTSAGTDRRIAAMVNTAHISTIMQVIAPEGRDVCQIFMHGGETFYVAGQLHDVNLLLQ